MSGLEGRIAAIERFAEQTQAVYEAERVAFAAERAQRHEEQAIAALRGELAKVVRPAALDTVTDLLFHARKAVQIGSDGHASVVLDGETHDMASGVASWAKTSEAQLFLPPPTRGPQARPAPAPAPVAGPPPPRGFGRVGREPRTPPRADGSADPALATARQLGWRV